MLRVATRVVVCVVLVSLLGPAPAAAAPSSGARFFGSTGGLVLNSPLVGFDNQSGGDGYTLTASDGGVFTFGSARFFGSTGAIALNQPVVDIAMAPGGDGYVLAAADGGVFTFGAAPFAGSLGSLALNEEIRGIVEHPSGSGYWLWARDGGVFAFGAARFAGSLPGAGADAEAVGMDRTRDGEGYWVATSDGRVFAFGSAPDLGSGDPSAPSPVVDLAAAPDGAGYALLHADGRVEVFGSAPHHGDVAGARLNAPMIAMRYTPLADGYWLLGADGGVFTFPGTELAPGGTPTLSVETVASGLTVPWDVDFPPGGPLLFTERGGRLAALAGGEVRTLATPADVRAVGEGGMTGLAVDPMFASNRLVHVCMNTTAGDVKVVSWQVDETFTTASRVRDLIVGIPANPTGRHSGCRPRFGPDGYLWVTTGDAASGTNPQSLTSLGGKVLRVDATTGAAAVGNPFGPIYTYGHRNPQGLDFRPGAGTPYSVEHGPRRDDEVNVLVAGGNYGWDPVPGYDESVPMTDLSRFPAAIPAVWTSGSSTIAASGGAFLDGAQWRDWSGRFVVAALKGSELRLLGFDAADRLVSQQTILSGYGRLRTPRQGPDGSLYVTTSNGAGTDVILRITPT